MAEAPQIISIDELEAMLLDPDIPDSALRPYLMESSAESGSFEPVVRINPAMVEETMLESALLLSSLNGIARRRRQERYRRAVAAGNPLRLVSEGDSWFQYPLLLDDVIDHLFQQHAIFSLDAAGDLVADMVEQSRELVAAIAAEDPAVILLSGGGNDLLGEGRLASALRPFDPALAPEEYLGPAFEANLRAILGSWEELLATVRGIAPGTPILCHSYDHAIPAKGRWLGKPMRRLGITDPALQRALIRLMVDRFHAELTALAARMTGVEVIDCRGAVRGRWHDELHPTNAGYRDVAARFAARIAALTGRAAVPGGVPEALEGMGDGDDLAEAVAAPADPAKAMAGWPDDALKAEIGLRALSRDAGDSDGFELSLLSLEATVPAFPAAADALLARARNEGVAALGLPADLAQMVEEALRRGL